MQADMLKLGFIGGGVNSAVGTTHFIASQMDGRFEVVAGCFSRHADVNQATGERWGIAVERVYETWMQFLDAERGKLDAVVVLTPTPEHTQPVVAALQRGYSVICEKALASHSDDAATIRDAARANDGFLAVTYNYTGYPMVRELRDFIRGGRLGRVTQIHVEMPQESFSRLNRDGQPANPQHWRQVDETVPTIYLDLGSHLHHLIDFLIGEKPLELVASQSTLGRVAGVKDNVMCMARYSGGIDCSIWFSKATLGHRNGQRIRVYGENGSAEWHQMNPEFLTFNDNLGRRTIVDRANVDVQIAHSDRYNRFKAGHPSGFLEAFANLYCDIADSLEAHLAGGRDRSDFVFDATDALEGLIMMETMVRSADERAWKTIEFPA